MRNPGFRVAFFLADPQALREILGTKNILLGCLPGEAFSASLKKPTLHRISPL